jgi:hypothetical protein
VSLTSSYWNSSLRNRPALTEEPRWPRHVGYHSSLLTGLDVLDLEITLVGHDLDRLNAENLFRGHGGLRQQPHIDDLVGDLLLDDQLVFGVHRRQQHACARPSRGYRGR